MSEEANRGPIHKIYLHRRHQLWRDIAIKIYLTSSGEKISSRRLALFYVFNKGANSVNNSSQRHFLKIVQLIHKTIVFVFPKTYLTSWTKTYFMNQPSACRESTSVSLRHACVESSTKHPVFTKYITKSSSGTERREAIKSTKCQTRRLPFCSQESKFDQS